jgi:tetratricopeptide (TPR) repeat protein
MEPEASESLAPGKVTAKDLLMRYTPVAIALSLVVAVSASTVWSAPPMPLDPEAARLEAVGKASLAAGDPGKATDAFEAALAVQPGHPQIILDLAEAARRQGMPGKALHYYRGVLAGDPQNQMALAGEGAAFAEKGAIDKAQRDLARLEGLCGGSTCDAARGLTAAIAKGANPKVVSAEDVQSKASATN